MEIQKSFTDALKHVNNKIGKEKLTEEDMLVLACADISRSYTRDEKGYT